MFGFYSKKDVEQIKKDYFAIGKNEGILQANEFMKEESDAKDFVIENLKKINKKTIDTCNEMLDSKNEHIKELLEEHKQESNTLRTLLTLDTDKEIERLEKISKRTRKIKVKKKCENRILDYKMRKIAYEVKK